MAGAGYKLFNTGDVLTAAQVNTYLQEQAVMRFANAAARTTALSGVLAEGMMSYLDDTNSVEVYNGSAWVNVGNTGDITGVTAGTGLSGGGTSGDVTLSLDQANFGGGQWAAGKNKIINGDFTVNQRNFSSASNTAGFKFDRWDVSSFNTGTITDSSQTFTPGTAPVAGYEGSTFYRVVTNTGAGNGNYYFLRQKVESVRTFANQSTVVSFWAKAASGTPKIAVEITQNFGSGGSPSSDVNTYIGQVTLSTSWTRYSIAVSVPTISGKTIGTTANTSSLQLNLWVTAGSNYNSRTGSLGIQDNTFDLWGVQWEAGSTATPFQTATGTLQGELAACQRYYQVVAAAVASIKTIGNVAAYTSTSAYGVYPTKVTMRTDPTLFQVTGTGYYNLVGNFAADAFNTLGMDLASPNQVRLTVTSDVSLTQGYAYWIETGNAATFVALQAEL